MTEYVVGFAFDSQVSSVLLIRKTKPEWQAGRWNGVGGKVEPGESPVDAMVREFEEETGLAVPAEEWSEFVELVDAACGWNVHFFRAFGVPICNAWSTTNEVVMEWPANGAETMDWIPNLRWLVPLAAQPEVGTGDPASPLVMQDASGVGG